MHTMAGVVAIVVGLILAIGGFGGKVRLHIPGLSIAGGAGIVVIILGFLLL